MNRHIWEGWTVQDFINEVEINFQNWPHIDDPKKLKEEIRSAQPYYKKHIPEVYNYFKKLNNKKLNTNNY
jgi:hypothetical protein